MFRTTHAGAFLSLFAFLITGTVAQESADFHQFTDKKGQRVSAMLLGVSADRQQMKIRREDGQEFETVINLLCLDDQQYVKDWMKKPLMADGTDSAKTDYRIDVALTRQTASVQKHTEGSMVLAARPTTFKIVIRNLSRDTLEGARLEYVLVWVDRATIYESEAKTRTYRATSDEAGSSPQVRKYGQTDLKLLRFNEEITVGTEPVSMEQVFRGENNPYLEDEMIGGKVRIVSKDGQVLHEADSGSAVIAAMKWDEILALPAPAEVERR